VGNTDRHHQNWGVLLERHVRADSKATLTLQLAPTFDHASSLGRELTDEARERHLREGTIAKYIGKGRGGIFESPGDKRGMSPLAVAQMIAARYPEFFKPWQTRVNELREEDLAGLLAQIPDECISESGRSFALAFLSTGRKLIGETK